MYFILTNFQLRYFCGGRMKLYRNVYFFRGLFALCAFALLIVWFQNCSKLSSESMSADKNSLSTSNPSDNGGNVEKSVKYEVKFLNRGVSGTYTGGSDLSARLNDVKQSMGNLDFQFSRYDQKEILEDSNYSYEIRSTTNNDLYDLDNREMIIFENQSGNFNLKSGNNSASISLRVVSPFQLQTQKPTYPNMFFHIKGKKFLLKIFKGSELIYDRLLTAGDGNSSSSVPNFDSYVQGTSQSFSYKIQFTFNIARFSSLKIDNNTEQETCRMCFDARFGRFLDENAGFFSYDKSLNKVSYSATEGSTIILKGLIEPDMDLTLDQNGMLFGPQLFANQFGGYVYSSGEETLTINDKTKEFILSRKLKAEVSPVFKNTETIGIDAKFIKCSKSDSSCSTNIKNIPTDSFYISLLNGISQKFMIPFASSVADPNLGNLAPNGWPSDGIFVFHYQTGEAKNLDRLTRDLEVSGIENYSTLHCGMSNCQMSIFNDSTGVYESIDGYTYGVPYGKNSFKLRISFHNTGSNQMPFISITASKKSEGNPSEKLYFYRVE